MGNSKSKKTKTSQDVIQVNLEELSKGDPGNAATPDQPTENGTGRKRQHEDSSSPSSKRQKTNDFIEVRLQPSAPPEEYEGTCIISQSCIDAYNACLIPKTGNNHTLNLTQQHEIDNRPTTILEGENCQLCNKPYLQSKDLYFMECGHYFHEKCAHARMVLDLPCPECSKQQNARDWLV